MSKCDLHIHSRYSARSEEWLFRRFDFPDSYSDPKELHQQSLERGMNYVTITDHDTIDGCLQIIDLPHTFISEQVTTYFPQDPCKLHILVWGISQEQHGKIEGVRDNIFELQHYLQIAQIAHAVAHPLYSINGQLDASHLERLILLFKHFEGINGLRDALLSDLAQILLRQLTPEKIDVFANRHNLAPAHAEPWKNVFAFYGRTRSNRIHARGKSEPGRTSCVVRKNFRPVQACKRVALEGAFRLFCTT